MEQANIDLSETNPDDPRIGPLLGQALEEGESSKAVFVGFPSDEGVRRNGGRPGAAKAPTLIRQALYKMTPDADHTADYINLVEHTNDTGNVSVIGDLEADQKKLGDAIAEYVSRGIIPIILGGGHETALGHFLGYAKADLKTAILNMDAHTDVRPLKDGKAHSGSPFRQAIEHESKCCLTYSVAGLQPHAIAKAHLDFIESHNGQYYFKDETNITTIAGLLDSHQSDRLMVTFDMDAVDQAFAPGVSAPCTNGLSPDLWLTAAYLAGLNEQVTSFDVSEVNPKFDRGGQTARLAALTVWHFMLGLSQRK